jgi:hypothetical protein
MNRIAADSRVEPANDVTIVVMAGLDPAIFQRER